MISLLLSSAATFVAGFAGAYLWQQSHTARLQERSAQLEAQLSDEKLKRDHAEQKESALKIELARTQEQIAALKNAQAQMQQWFENTANRVVKETSAQLGEASQKQLDAVLAPMKERLVEFQKKVDDVYDAESRERIGLKVEIEKLLESTRISHDATNNLTTALKGDPRQRGHWGEVVLDNILRDSGLVDGREYITQGRGLELKDENGRRQAPDVIIRMPQDRHIIIDSKVTLISYMALIEAEDDAARLAARSDYLAAVKKHIDELSAKKYQDNDKLIAHDFVLMFIPIESALAAVLDGDQGLQSYAWSRRVALVGPSTLMMTLRNLSYLWQGERQERHASEIAREAAGLYNQVRLVVETLNSLGKHLENAQGAYDEALKRLADGKGNVIRRVESFRERGFIEADKPIPELSHSGEVEEG